VTGIKDFLLALLPSAGVLFIFYLAIKAILEADRRERAAVARMDAQRPPATDEESVPPVPPVPPPAANTDAV
jgi:threonine/homoserine/homoserine lactone efflux protein